MNAYLTFLSHVVTRCPALQSDFARYNAKFVAEAASRGHITSLISGKACNTWFVTHAGMSLLKEGKCHA